MRGERGNWTRSWMHWVGLRRWVPNVPRFAMIGVKEVWRDADLQDIKSSVDDLRDIQTEHDLLDSALKKLQTVKAELSKREIERDQLTARADVCTSILGFISPVFDLSSFPMLTTACDTTTTTRTRKTHPSSTNRRRSKEQSTRGHWEVESWIYGDGRREKGERQERWRDQEGGGGVREEGKPWYWFLCYCSV